jgi:hypothetical protein
MEEIKEFIQTTEYQKVVDLFVSSYKIELTNDEYDAAYEDDLDKMNKAKVTINDLATILKSDEIEIKKFSKYFSEKLSKYEDNNEQEYPEGEEVEDEDEDIEDEGFLKDFLIGYLIEYHILKNNINDLEKYTKEIRIPYSKKYAQELKDIYSKL